MISYFPPFILMNWCIAGSADTTSILVSFQVNQPCRSCIANGQIIPARSLSEISILASWSRSQRCTPLTSWCWNIRCILSMPASSRWSKRQLHCIGWDMITVMHTICSVFSLGLRGNNTCVSVRCVLRMIGRHTVKPIGIGNTKSET